MGTDVKPSNCSSLTVDAAARFHSPASRCADCHAIKQDLLMSLVIQEMALERMNLRPRVRNLDVNQDEHARYVIAQKMA
jgi:hypothetical protein